MADAAALLTALQTGPAQVIGFSAGNIVALVLAARNPDLVAELVLWETPVLALLPDDAVLSDSVTACAQANLDQHPGDYGGAFPVLMTALGILERDLASRRFCGWRGTRRR